MQRRTRGRLAGRFRPAISALYRSCAARRAVPRHVVGLPLCDDRRDADTRLKQDGIDKSTITAFTLVFLVYNFKFLWAWIVDGVRLPLLGRLGQRVSWMLLCRACWSSPRSSISRSSTRRPASASVRHRRDPASALPARRFDIVIDAYRIEILEPRQLGVGSGMSQYGWRIGSAGAGALALVVAARSGWQAAYLACAALALPAMLTALVMGEPKRHREPVEKKGVAGTRRGRVAAVRRVLPAQGRVARAAVHPAAQDRRHARQPDLPAAVRRPRVHQRRDRASTTSASASGPI